MSNVSMNYKFWKNAAIAAGVVGILGLGGTALAQSTTVQNTLNNQEGIFKKAVKQGWQNMRQDMKAIQDAISKRDYQTWKDLISKDGRNAKLLEKITADNFSKFADMHDAMQKGDKATAEAIRQELGLPDRPVMVQRRGWQVHTPEEQAQIKKAIIDKNFEAWKALVSVNGKLPPQFKTITADNFAKFSEMYRLMAQAEQIRKELGIIVPGRGRGMDCGFGMGRFQE